MIRSFAVGLITIIVVVALSTLRVDLFAQQPGAAGPGSVPIQFSGGTAGVNLELFINAGKVADVTINSSGQGSSILDLSNLGKVQLQVYVDVCQDGKVVRVLVVAGQPKPDDNCKRRIVGGAWWSDCGVTRITLDLTKFGMHVIGCGAFYTDPKYLVAIGGGAALIPILAGGGGSSTSTFASTPTPTPTATTTTPTTTTPPTTTPPVTTPTPTPTNTTVTVPIDFTVALTPGYNHPGGSTSIACFLIAATAVGNAPALNQSATFSGTITGPGVVSGGTFSGNLSAAGQALAQAVINSFGSYVTNVTVVFGAVSRQVTGQINVQSNQSSCATPR